MSSECKLYNDGGGGQGGFKGLELAQRRTGICLALSCLSNAVCSVDKTKNPLQRLIGRIQHNDLVIGTH